MGFAEAVRTCLSRYVTFSGRAARPEYWWFALFYLLASLAGTVIDYLLFGGETVVTETGFEAQVSPTPVTGLVQLGLLLPMLAAGWRRMHDRGLSGWRLFLPHACAVAGLVIASGLGAIGAVTVSQVAMAAGLLAGLGFQIWVFVQLVSRGEAGPNAFGPPPG